VRFSILIIELLVVLGAATGVGCVHRKRPNGGRWVLQLPGQSYEHRRGS
jgi:hypothetical protein